MRVALYARYSSENQKDSSIEQQMRLLHERVAAEGWTIAGEYEDKALSGTNMLRPGLQRMLAASQDKMFDIILSESIDRLSRDLADIAVMHKRLNHRGIRIITLMEGEITAMHVAMKGSHSEWYIKDLSKRTYRGLHDRALQGESAGGLSNGYDIEPVWDEKRGRRVGGLRTVNEQQAAVVRRIYKDYCEGKSPKRIAADLNGEGVPGPRGGTWSSSTI